MGCTNRFFFRAATAAAVDALRASAVRGGGTLLPTEIVNAVYLFGGREVTRLLETCAADFFCPARERAARRLADLRAHRTDPPWG